MHDDRYYRPDEAIRGFVWLGGWILSLTRGYVFSNPPFHLFNGSDLSEQEIVLLPKMVGGAQCIKENPVFYTFLYVQLDTCAYTFLSVLASCVSCACLPITVYHLNWLSQSSESQPDSWLIKGGGWEVTVKLSFPAEIYLAHHIEAAL